MPQTNFKRVISWRGVRTWTAFFFLCVARAAFITEAAHTHNESISGKNFDAATELPAFTQEFSAPRKNHQLRVWQHTVTLFLTFAVVSYFVLRCFSKLDIKNSSHSRFLAMGKDGTESCEDEGKGNGVGENADDPQKDKDPKKKNKGIRAFFRRLFGTQNPESDPSALTEVHLRGDRLGVEPTVDDLLLAGQMLQSLIKEIQGGERKFSIEVGQCRADVIWAGAELMDYKTRNEYSFKLSKERVRTDLAQHVAYARGRDGRGIYTLNLTGVPEVQAGFLEMVFVLPSTKTTEEGAAASPTSEGTSDEQLEELRQIMHRLSLEGDVEKQPGASQDGSFTSESTVLEGAEGVSDEAKKDKELAAQILERAIYSLERKFGIFDFEKSGLECRVEWFGSVTGPFLDANSWNLLHAKLLGNDAMEGVTAAVISAKNLSGKHSYELELNASPGQQGGKLVFSFEPSGPSSTAEDSE